MMEISAPHINATLQHSVNARYGDFLTFDPQLQQLACKLAGSDPSAAELPHFCLVGPVGSGHHAFARWVWKKNGNLARPFIHAPCGLIKGLRDLQRHFVLAHKGDLFLPQIETLAPQLWDSLQYFSQCDPSVRIIASLEEKTLDEVSPLLRELCRLEVPLLPISQRRHEVPALLTEIARSFGLNAFPEAEQSYIEQHTLSLRYSQFVYCIQRMCEIAVQQGKAWVDLEIIRNLVGGSKKMLLYSQLLFDGYFARVMGDTKSRGIKETIQVIEAAIIAKTLQETFNCLAHTARILQLPVNTLASRQKVLAPHIEVFNRVLGAIPEGGR
jgi:DNA-binding NtrC family response regulator